VFDRQMKMRTTCRLTNSLKCWADVLSGGMIKSTTGEMKGET
jgi:hypothetical protein